MKIRMTKWKQKLDNERKWKKKNHTEENKQAGLMMVTSPSPLSFWVHANAFISQHRTAEAQVGYDSSNIKHSLLLSFVKGEC